MGESKFSREVSYKLINKLKKEKLFQDKLLKDIKIKEENDGYAFPAIRDTYFSFYYKGGGIFEYRGSGFSTHSKYAVGKDIEEGNSKNNFTEKKLLGKGFKISYYDKYDDIKKNCQNLGTSEAEGVSNLYECSGVNIKVAGNDCGKVILLDTEIHFPKAKNRIDLLLYDTEDKLLCFCEAKPFSSINTKKMWQLEKGEPDVYKQINRYTKTVKELHSIIIEQYKIYVERFNALFDTDIPTPKNLFSKVGLLIFNYGSDQADKIDQLSKKDSSLGNINYYAVEDLKSENITELFSALTKEN